MSAFLHSVTWKWTGMPCVLACTSLVVAAHGGAALGAEKPNIILCMTDDQGWGDTSYNGHPVLRTPNLDKMAADGIRFNRFYAQHCVCSPTRGSCMTGRHPNRYRCYGWGHDLPLREVTVAEAVKTAGYVTGHFGKWHLGGIAHAPGGTGRGVPESFDPKPRHPGSQGFDEWFSHGNWFDLSPEHMYHNGRPVGRIEGDTSDIVMEKALEFVRRSAAAEQPLLAVVWFPSPHGPSMALAKDRAPYASHEEMADYYGEIAAVDRAMGSLRRELRRLGIHRNTMLWFCSDNGGYAPGSQGGLSGRKGNLLEGGIRVPGILEWPARVTRPFVTDVPACTSDFYPTILDLLGIEMADQVEPLDGISLLPLLDGKMTRRPKPLAFEIRRGPEGTPAAAALIDNEHKLLSGTIRHRGRPAEKLPRPRLFDLSKDAKEQHDIAAEKPEIVRRMSRQLTEWQQSVEANMKQYPAAKSKEPTRL